MFVLYGSGKAGQRHNKGRRPRGALRGRGGGRNEEICALFRLTVYPQMGPYVLEIQEMEKKIKDLESQVIQAVGSVLFACAHRRRSKGKRYGSVASQSVEPRAGQKESERKNLYGGAASFASP